MHKIKFRQYKKEEIIDQIISSLTSFDAY